MSAFFSVAADQVVSRHGISAPPEQPLAVMRERFLRASSPISLGLCSAASSLSPQE